MRRWYERLRWWWYRVTGRDCTAWMQSLIDRAAKSGEAVYVPRGEYYVGKHGPWHRWEP